MESHTAIAIIADFIAIRGSAWSRDRTVFYQNPIRKRLRIGGMRRHSDRKRHWSRDADRD